MFRHCVMLKFNDQASELQKVQALDGIRSLPEHIEQIVSYSAGFNAGTRTDNYDVVAVGDFFSKEDYEIYAEHPKHQEVISVLLAPIIQDRKAIQYFWEE